MATYPHWQDPDREPGPDLSLPALIGAVLDAEEEVANDLREDPGVEALLRTVAALRTAVEGRRPTLEDLRARELAKEGPGPSLIDPRGSGEDLSGRPEWWKYELYSNRVYVDVNGEDSIPLVSNYPGTDTAAVDEEPQRYVPLYLDFELGRIFYYETEAKDLGAL